MTRITKWGMAIISTGPLALSAAMLCAPTASASAASFTASAKIPINLSVFVSCAQGGAGEIVELSGTLHDLFHVTFDGAGGFHIMIHDNPQGVSGVGLTSGDKYQATGVTLEEDNVAASGLPFEFTFVNNFRIIGQGSGNNFLVHENTHVTINANGDVTAVVDNFSIECK